MGIEEVEVGVEEEEEEAKNEEELKDRAGKEEEEVKGRTHVLETKGCLSGGVEVAVVDRDWTRTRTRMGRVEEDGVEWTRDRGGWVRERVPVRTMNMARVCF